MSEIINNAGATSEAAAGSLDPGGPEGEARLVGGIAPPPLPTPAPEPAPAPAPAEPALSDLAASIRAERARREAQRAEQQKQTGLHAELEAARAELARMKAISAFEDDPVGYAKSRGWTEEQQLMFGKSLLFDLAPDKADPMFRQQMFEERQARKEREREAKQREEQERAAAEYQQRQLHGFFEETAQAVASFEAGSFPESEAWFGDDVNSYMQSLMATARNVATAAEREGRVADLSARALAGVLEAETARRMAARDQRRTRKAAPAAAQAPAQPDDGEQPVVETLSSKHMSGTGTPRGPALTEEERIARAVSAGWGRR